MKSVLLATVFAVGTIAAASAQSQMNQTPPNAQRDPTHHPGHPLHGQGHEPAAASSDHGLGLGGGGQPDRWRQERQVHGHLVADPAVPGRAWWRDVRRPVALLTLDRRNEKARLCAGLFPIVDAKRRSPVAP